MSKGHFTKREAERERAKDAKWRKDREEKRVCVCVSVCVWEERSSMWLCMFHVENPEHCVCVAGVVCGVCMGFVGVRVMQMMSVVVMLACVSVCGL